MHGAILHSTRWGKIRWPRSVENSFGAAPAGRFRIRPAGQPTKNMKTTSIAALLGASALAFAFSSCKSKEEKVQDDVIEQKADMKEDQADEVRAKAETKADMKENQADAIRHSSDSNAAENAADAKENAADATREAAEKKADGMENQADGIRDQK